MLKSMLPTKRDHSPGVNGERGASTASHLPSVHHGRAVVRRTTLGHTESSVERHLRSLNGSIRSRHVPDVDGGQIRSATVARVRTYSGLSIRESLTPLCLNEAWIRPHYRSAKL